MTINDSTISNPPIGLHRDVPAELYHRAAGASNSRLQLLQRSPAHCKAAMDHPPEPTPALILGEAAHLCILQPHLFTEHYIVAEPCSARLKSGPRAGECCDAPGKNLVGDEWFCSMHSKGLMDSAGTRQKLSQDDFDRAQCIRDAVHAHPAAKELLASATSFEASFFWRHQDHGVICKGRADILAAGGIIGDVKTTLDASKEEFARSVYKFGYHCQGAHYVDGLTTLGKSFSEFRIIAAEKEPPFAVAVYRLTMADLERGFALLQSLLATWKRCTESGKWPAYSEGVQELALPAWAARKMDLAIEE